MEVIPAIMPDSSDDLLDKLDKVAGLVSTVQLDVMDGDYVESVSWPYFASQYEELELIREGERLLPQHEELFWEVDLMVIDPEMEALRWAKSGARRLIVHLGSIRDVDTLDWLILHFRRPGEMELGLAVNSSVDIEALAVYAREVDMIQFMGIERIGYQGQPFDAHVIDSIRSLREQDQNVIISVDGGVTIETAPLLVDAGANRLVSGSGIFSADDPAQAIDALHHVGD